MWSLLIILIIAIIIYVLIKKDKEKNKLPLDDLINGLFIEIKHDFDITKLKAVVYMSASVQVKEFSYPTSKGILKIGDHDHNYDLYLNNDLLYDESCNNPNLISSEVRRIILAYFKEKYKVVIEKDNEVNQVKNKLEQQEKINALKKKYS